jgi:broad specificity phosphatase PhoE
MSEKIHIPIAKHLEDQDDLLENRDAGLVPGQEQRASDMAESIYEHAISHEFKILLFCISPKKRAMETAELVKKNLADKEIQLPIISEIGVKGTFVLVLSNVGKRKN